jgi:hypothetical protein
LQMPRIVFADGSATTASFVIESDLLLMLQRADKKRGRDPFRLATRSGTLRTKAAQLKRGLTE